MVAEYTGNPPVLDPGGTGTIMVVILKIGTVSADKAIGADENSNTTYTLDYDDTVNIERVMLEGNGIEVLSPVFDHTGQLGSGESLPIAFHIRAR
jgi:hypothetical protein